MITRDEKAARALVQADVPRIVAGSLDHLERVGTALEPIAVGDVGEHGVALQRQELRRHVQARAVIGERHVRLLLQGGRLQKQRSVDGLFHGHEVFHLLEGMKVREHRHARTPDAVEVARMVGMRVGQHDLHLVP